MAYRENRFNPRLKTNNLIDPTEQVLQAELKKAKDSANSCIRNNEFHTRAILRVPIAKTIMAQESGIIHLYGQPAEPCVIESEKRKWREGSFVPVLLVAWEKRRYVPNTPEIRTKEPILRVHILFGSVYASPRGSDQDRFFNETYTDNRTPASFVDSNRFFKLKKFLKRIPWIRMTRKYGRLTDRNMTDAPLCRSLYDRKRKDQFVTFYKVIESKEEHCLIIANKPENPTKCQLVFSKNGRRHHANLPLRFCRKDHSFFQKHLANGDLFRLALVYGVKMLVKRSTGMIPSPKINPICLSGGEVNVDF